MNANFPASSDLTAYDGRSIVLNILSFALPPLGLVLYLALMIAKLPMKAVSVGRSATFGLCSYGAVIVLIYVIVGILSVVDYYQNSGDSARATIAAPPSFVHPPKP